jgi:hypothetical protein
MAASWRNIKKAFESKREELEKIKRETDIPVKPQPKAAGLPEPVKPESMDALIRKSKAAQEKYKGKK